MSKINFNDLHDYYEEEGYDLCSKCGEHEFEYDEETETHSICVMCGHHNHYTPKNKKNKVPVKKNRLNNNDFYDND